MADLRTTIVGEFLAFQTNYTNLTLDTSTTFLAFIVQAEEAATITELGFHQALLSGTSPTWKIGFQTRGADGEPDGTYLGGGSEQSASFTISGANDNSWIWITLDNSRAVTRGEILCIVIEYVSGTIDGSNNVSLSRTSQRTPAGFWGFPYSANASAGSWTLQDDYPCWGMKTSSRSYGDMLDGAGQTTFDANDSPDEHGNAFTIPDGVSETAQIIGVGFVLDWNDLGAGNNLILALYNDTTLLQEVSLEGRGGSIAAESGQMFYFDEATLSSLNPGTQYIVSCRTDDTSVTISMRQDSFSAAQDLAGCSLALPGWSVAHAERTNGGAWGINTSEYMRMRLIIKDITEPSGGGLVQRQSIHTNIGTY